MPRTSQQNQIIRETTQARLIDSAMVLFAEHGYANTSIRKIAKHAGVSVGLLYHYFPHKESLLQAVFEHCMAILVAGTDGVTEIEDPAERLVFFIQYIFETLQQEQLFWSLFQSLRAQPAVVVILGDALRAWTKLLRDHFMDFLREAGRPQPELDAYVLYSLIEGTIQQYLLEPENYPLEAVVTRIINQFSTE